MTFSKCIRMIRSLSTCSHQQIHVNLPQELVGFRPPLPLLGTTGCIPIYLFSSTADLGQLLQARNVIRLPESPVSRRGACRIS